MVQNQRGTDPAPGGVIDLEQARLIRELRSELEDPALRQRFGQWAAEQEDDMGRKSKETKEELIPVSFRLTHEEDAALERIAELLTAKLADLGVKPSKIIALRYSVKLALEQLEGEAKKGKAR